MNALNYFQEWFQKHGESPQALVLLLSVLQQQVRLCTGDAELNIKEWVPAPNFTSAYTGMTVPDFFHSLKAGGYSPELMRHYQDDIIEWCRLAQIITESAINHSAVSEPPGAQAGPESESDSPAEKSPVESPEKTGHFRDLRGVKCPMNFVKTKLELAKIEAGARLEVWLDHGAPIENVPRSVVMEGHKILSKERRDGYWSVEIEKH